MNVNFLKNLFHPVLTALFTLAALNTQAAITFDTASSTAAGANATTVAWSHTINPDPTGSGMLVVNVAIETTTTDRPVSSGPGFRGLDEYWIVRGARR